MKTFNNLDLYSKNSMHLHCIAETVKYPESIDELSEIISVCRQSNEPFHILGGGSNVVLPSKLVGTVIYLNELSNSIEYTRDFVVVGSSVRIQKLIRDLQKRDLGGIEYLFSLPCCVGGATLMNAGRGGKGSPSISDYIVSVEVFNLKTCSIEVINKAQCLFDYRKSVFQNKDYIILKTTFAFPYTHHDDVEKRIKERMEISRTKLSADKPSCGSVFVLFNGKILSLLQGLRIGGAQYSRKTLNWISNTGNAKYWQIKLLVDITIIIHELFRKPYKLEIEIW